MVSSTDAENGLWAVVLGVTGGSGAAIARAVAQRPGLDIFGVHRGNLLDRVARLEGDVNAQGRRLHLRTAEGGTAQAAVLGAQEVLRTAGPRSVKLFVHAIANASVGLLAADQEKRLRPRQFEKTFESMAHSFVYWTQELLARDLLAPNARLLGLSNPIGDTVLRDTALIAASKAALEIYVRHLAHELGPRGHRVNLLKFGAVKTVALDRTFGDRQINRLSRTLELASPARRVCSVEEVGRFVSVLAGEDGAWFNGANIDFTGGEFQGFLDAMLRAEEG